MATLKCLQSIENSIVIYKGHAIGVQLNEMVNFKSKFLIYKDPDPYPLMNLCDLLITDYSSLFIDFSVTGKAFILYMYDYDKYEKSVGLYFDLKNDFKKLSCFHEKELLQMANSFLNGSGDLKYCQQLKKDFIFKENSSLFNIKLFEQKFL